MIRFNVCLFALFASAGVTGSSQTNAEWRDPSEHRIRMVKAEGVDLEVLDWGGTGRPLVFLAGYQTAHVYDEFAPRLTSVAHVYGITRRGFGASNRTPSGYTAIQSARDVVQVLDHLGLSDVVLAGHSFGGQDLTTIAEHFPDRVTGLIYLNSAEDPTLTATDYGAKPPDMNRLPASFTRTETPDKSSPTAYRRWQLRTHGVAFPEAEVRQFFPVRSDGSLGAYTVGKETRDAMAAGLTKPDFTLIRVPTLAFFAVPPEVSLLLATYNPANKEEEAAVVQKRAFDVAIVERHVRDLQAGVPNARIVRLAGANYYVFVSNPDGIVEDIFDFLRDLCR